ncbi:helix-turn-helix domain-containing protein [Campylobacter sp. MOP7]|uniref:helix-turn-helix domain-containing protein n=1 Tax=Campylobacter canis TaxID=3378588 RepID=UPI00387E9DD7
MVRISTAQYMKMHNIVSREVLVRLLDNNEIPGVIVDSVTKAVSILVPDKDGDTTISPELQAEIDMLKNPNRITLAKYAAELGLDYSAMYAGYYLKGKIKNTFKDKVSGKITVLISDDMYQIKSTIAEPQDIQLKEVAKILGLNESQLRYIINPKKEISVIKYGTGSSFLYVTKDELIRYINKKKNSVRDVRLACARKKLISIDEACRLLNKRELTVNRMIDEGVLKVEVFKKERYITSASLYDVFFDSGVFSHDIFVSNIDIDEIEEKYGGEARQDGKIMTPEEIVELPRVSLKDFADKHSRKTYFSLLNDFYAGKLDNAGQDNVTRNIFVILYNKKINPDCIDKTFNSGPERIELTQWARNNNMNYNKAKTMVMNQEIKGALYDPVCNAYSVELEGDYKGFTPYIRLDQEKYIDDKKPFYSHYDFANTFGISTNYLRNMIKDGVIKLTKRGNKKVIMRKDIDAFFEERQKAIDNIVKLLNKKDEYTQKEMCILTNRPKKFVTLIAIKRKWLPSKNEGELYTKKEYCDFLNNHDKYWSTDEKEQILAAC